MVGYGELTQKLHTAQILKAVLPIMLVKLLMVLLLLVLLVLSVAHFICALS